MSSGVCLIIITPGSECALRRFRRTRRHSAVATTLRFAANAASDVAALLRRGVIAAKPPLHQLLRSSEIRPNIIPLTEEKSTGAHPAI